MSDTNNRIPGPAGEEQPREPQTPAAQSPDEILAQINLDEIGFPSDLVSDLVTDLGVAPAVSPVVAPVPAAEPAEVTPAAESEASSDEPVETEDQSAQAPAADATEEESVPAEAAPGPAEMEMVPEQPQEPPAEPEQPTEDAAAVVQQETVSEPAADGSAAPEEQAESEAAEEAPVEDQPAAAPAPETAAEPENEQPAPAENAAQPEGLSEDEEELPPVTENALTVPQKSEDPTAGMTLVQRAQYHARMRRREQTRLRRENARREAAGMEVTYQPMSVLDIRFTLIRLAVAAVFLLLGLVLSSTPVSFPLYLVAYLITMLPVFAKVAQNFAHGKYFDEYLLILVASLGAFLLRNYAEASVVLILHGVGKIASDLVLNSTHKSVAQQTPEVPEKASVVNMKGEERQVAPSEVRVGEFVLVRSGERVPVDGIVLRGDGTVDDAALTGDTEPLQVEKNIRVLAGSLFNGSLMLLRAAAKFEDCALSQMIRVQEEGRDREASLEKSAVHGVSRIIPIVIILAVLLAVIPPLFNSSTSISNWIYRALIILVVCCPTAMAISVPLCFACGTGRLSRKGIHVKGSEAVEKMAELRMAVFDKTGTLTEGMPHVKEIYETKDFNQESILALAAAAEQLSNHPVARAVVAAYQGKPQKISEFEEFPGRGVRARIGNRNLLAGNRRLMVSRGVKGVPDIRGTVVYVAYEGDYAGAIVLEDNIRSEAAEAIKGLKSQGVLRTVILTGDTESPAQQTANAIGIDTVHFGLQPEEKASKMEFLMRTIPTDGTAAYIGDGINDIEELKLADVGIAMGASGTRQTAEAANVLIMTSNLNRLNDAVRISHRTHGIAMQNMIFVLLIKLILVLLTVFGVTYMWQAVAADVLVTVLAVLNAARILGTK